MAKEINTPKEEKFVNPLEVSYPEFIKALDGKTVKEYLTGKTKADGSAFNEADINWLTNEVEAHVYNEANKKENLARAWDEHKALTIENEKEVK